jgi:hypothetical protein
MAACSNHSSKPASYSTAQTQEFESIASTDAQTAALMQADATGLIKTAEDICTYRYEGHSAAQLERNLESEVSQVPGSVFHALTQDAETAYCPRFLQH